jgi:hypothetical protein
MSQGAFTIKLFIEMINIAVLLAKAFVAASQLHPSLIFVSNLIDNTFLHNFTKQDTF